MEGIVMCPHVISLLLKEYYFSFIGVIDVTIIRNCWHICSLSQ